jgi:quercetin dioxygenase-like cupin family protein
MATSAKLERDAVSVDPKHYTVEAETDKVRVVRIRYKAGEKSIMHQHAPGVGVFLTDGDFTFTYPDGRVEQVKSNRGDFLSFEEPWEHLPENNADQDFEALYVEVKT